MKTEAEKDIKAKTKIALKVVSDEEKAYKKRVAGGSARQPKKKQTAMERLMGKC